MSVRPKEPASMKLHSAPLEKGSKGNILSSIYPWGANIIKQPPFLKYILGKGRFYETGARPRESRPTYVQCEYEDDVYYSLPSTEATGVYDEIYGDYVYYSSPPVKAVDNNSKRTTGGSIKGSTIPNIADFRLFQTHYKYFRKERCGWWIKSRWMLETSADI